MIFLRAFIKSMAGKGDDLGISLDLPEKHSPEDVERAVCLLIDPKKEWMIDGWLRPRIKEAKPYLEELFLHGNLPVERIQSSRSEAGVRQRIMSWLAEAGSQTIEREILSLWKRKNSRTLAAEWAGALASVAVLPVIEAALKDENSGRAIASLLRAYRRDGNLNAIASKILPDLYEALRRDIRGLHYRDLASLLLRLDRENAIQVLTSPKLINSKNEDVGSILKVLRAYRIPVDADLLGSLFNQIVKTRQAKWRKASNLGEIVESLAVTRHPETLDFVAQFDKVADSISRFHGVSALEIWHGIDPWGMLMERDPEATYRSLTKPQKLYAAVFSLVGQTCNGGIDQYFANPSGNHVRLALEGLRAMQLNEIADALEAEMRKFGPRGPSKDQTIRNRRLDSMLSESEEESVDENGLPRIVGVTDLIIDRSDQINQALLDWAIVHRDQFTCTKPRREFGML